MAASKESQNVCHASESPENCGKLSFGSLVEFPNPSFVRCACRILLTLVLDGASVTAGVSISSWGSTSGRVTVLKVSVSLAFSVTLIELGALGVDDEIGRVEVPVAVMVASGGDRGGDAGEMIAWLCWRNSRT